MNRKNVTRQRPSKYLIIMSIILSVLCMVLLVFDVIQCREANLRQSCKEKETYLDAMLYSGNYTADGIIAYIESEYPTSASDYCFIAVDEEIIFIRDVNFTKGLTENDLQAYFGISEHTPKVEGCKNAYSVLLGGASWYVMYRKAIVDEKEMVIGICSSESYLISEGDFDILMQHSVLYMALFSVAFVVSVFFLSHREKENAAMEEKLTQQLVENRRLIERLGERLEAQTGMDYQRENGFCAREVFEGVMEKLTQEQRLRSRKLEIRMRNTSPEAIVKYSVLLERMKVSKSICCLWDDDTFLVLLLNTDENGASNFIKQFLLEYQKMFRSDAEDIQVSTKEW